MTDQEQAMISAIRLIKQGYPKLARKLLKDAVKKAKRD